MGISGTWTEIGSGVRIALAKLAIQKYEEKGRPLRIAVDISIWQFQAQAGKGGKNPELRTLYFRILRLLSISVQPMFVFDGLKKPPFKRNRATRNHGSSALERKTKLMLDLFGIPFLVAPGEAEAECALLQKHGIVDAVLSEDVDTLMFGASVCLRNWSSLDTRRHKTPTHVDMHRSEDIRNGAAKLDREGMILVALMSGGDYLPSGISKCGVKLACEAARAGFGHDLCKISEGDTKAFHQWRNRLQDELHSNKSGYFKTRHLALQVPETFPNLEVLGYYTRPEVSRLSQISQYRDQMRWKERVNIPGLRQFVAQCFDWKTRSGAKKFIRGIAPVLLLRQLLDRTDMMDHEQDPRRLAEEEAKFILGIFDDRVHQDTDGLPEVRVSYVPADLACLDLDAEPPDEQSDADGSDEEAQEQASGPRGRSRSNSPAKRSTPYDPTQVEKIWLSKAFLKLGLPVMMGLREAARREAASLASCKTREREGRAKKTLGGMYRGALEPFLTLSKPNLSYIPIPESSTRKPMTRSVEQVKVPQKASITTGSQRSSLQKNDRTKLAASAQHLARGVLGSWTLEASASREKGSDEVKRSKNSATAKAAAHKSTSHRVPEVIDLLSSSPISSPHLPVSGGNNIPPLELSRLDAGDSSHVLDEKDATAWPISMKSKISSQSPSISTTAASPAPSKPGLQKGPTACARKHARYVPRESLPGFFEEIAGATNIEVLDLR